VTGLLRRCILLLMSLLFPGEQIGLGRDEITVLAPAFSSVQSRKERGRRSQSEHLANSTGFAESDWPWRPSDLEHWVSVRLIA
jgi:hypothetical protein